MADTDIIDISLALRKLPFRPVIDCDGPLFTVTLRPHIGPAVSGTAPSFAIAYTVALNQLRGAALVNHVDEVAS